MGNNPFAVRALSKAISSSILTATMVYNVPLLAADSSRTIEEVVVSAERRESSVQDTSISVTAVTATMMEDFGIRNQSDLQNLVPATTIQPYDATVRGVGRNFRTLGGDPGVATYMNGVYSEDLYTATIGSFWDIDRIEVLRGPQGTLYGRNAVGGAINFLYNKPSDEFELKLKTVQGNFDTEDYYGMVSGPVIEGVLNARFAGSMRKHEGYVEDKGPGPDLDSGDEKNGAISVEWLINEDMTLNLRSNKAKVDRVMGGAFGANGPIVLSGENFIPGEEGVVFGSRNYVNQSHGLRAVSATTNADDLLSRSYRDPNQQVFSFTNPTTGAIIEAQRSRPGIDSVLDGEVNYGRDVSNVDPLDCVFLDRDDINGDDLCGYTNGLNNEKFNQQGNQLEFAWEVREGLTFKYIFGYNEFLYERTTDEDSLASFSDDRQFYVNQEAEYKSHELQLFWDVGDDLTFTSGVFFYDSTLNQRGDFFTTSNSSQFTDPSFADDTLFGGPPAPSLTVIVGGGAPTTLYSAKELAATTGAPQGALTTTVGSWVGDASIGSVKHGPNSLGSSFNYATKTERDAFAAYTQGVWDIDDRFTLTAGIRYAYDDVYGEENFNRYVELLPTTDFGIPLAVYNAARGALDPATGFTPIEGGPDPVLRGIPVTVSAHRNLQRKDEEVTWRVNLDYNLSDDELIYLNVTTGYRSGGYNLAFFSQTPEYEPEELIAYEVGYKAQFLDNSLQVNSSIYYYDYDSIHTFTQESCDPAGPDTANPKSLCDAADVATTNAVRAAPGAEMKGFELELLWLVSDAITVGGNYSYTDSEYTKSFLLTDGSDPSTPSDIYDLSNNFQRAKDIKGNRLLQVPKQKASVYAMYNLSLGQIGTVDLLANWSWIDDVYYSPFETDLDRGPAYDRVDMRVTWASEDEHWVVSGFVNNILDEIGIRQITRGDAQKGYIRTAQVTEPRSYGLEISYNL